MDVNPVQVEETFIYCLYREDELLEDGSPPEGCVRVEGLVANYGLEPNRLKTTEELVRSWASRLPDEFRSEALGGKGGWSFLNMCQDRDGNQWTGQHKTMEQLCALMIAHGIAKWLMPKELWKMLPRGMPYIVITDGVQMETPSPKGDGSRV